MIGGSRLTASLRSLSVVALGALAVHQLRYLIGYGSGADAALQHQGHGYLSSLVPGLVALGVAAALVTVVAGRLGVAPRRPRLRPIARSSIYALILITTYCSQELFEGLIATGHPGGLPALIGHGGWVVLPLAVCFGALAALSVRGLEAIQSRVRPARSTEANQRPPLRLGHPRPQLSAHLPRLPLAFGLARRPPPSLGV